MDVVLWLIVTSVIVNGIIAGVSFDVAAVKLPTRRRIGPVAYAQFARGNDLGNGKIVYPLLGVLTLLLVMATTIVAWAKHEPVGIMAPLLIAAVFTLLHSACTAKAAPIMLSLAKTPDDPKVLGHKLNRFAFWHGFRAVFQIVGFVVLVWALTKIA